MSRTLFIAAGAAAVLLAGLGAFFLLPAHRSAIDEADYVRLGGIEQYVRIRSDNPKNPVLLFLHGGPGFSAMGLGPQFQPWEKHFTVVQWDQRGTGRTFGRNGPDTPLTGDRMVADGIELAALLDKRFHTKVLLVGHSWGTLLGLRMAHARPDLFAGFVATGLYVNRAASEEITTRRLTALAQTRGDAQTLAALRNCGDCAQRRAIAAQIWAASYSAPEERRVHDRIAKLVRNGPEVLWQNSRDIADGVQFSRQRLTSVQDNFNAFDEAPDLALPFFVIQGDEDVQTSPELARRYFDSVHAPVKRYVGVPGAGHYLPFYPSGVFLKALLTVSTASAPPGRTASPG